LQYRLRAFLTLGDLFGGSVFVLIDCR
jgi:hypothetical protein